jgi:hypothetical protein
MSKSFITDWEIWGRPIDLSSCTSPRRSLAKPVRKLKDPCDLMSPMCCAISGFQTSKSSHTLRFFSRSWRLRVPAAAKSKKGLYQALVVIVIPVIVIPVWCYAEPSPQYPQSALGISGRVVQGDQFPRRVVLGSERIRGVRVNYRQDISAADSTENEVLLVNGDNSVSFVEYRIVVHRFLDARFSHYGSSVKIEISRFQVTKVVRLLVTENSTPAAWPPEHRFFRLQVASRVTPKP